MSENKEENSVPAADVKEEEKSEKTEESKTPDESSKDSEKDSVKEDSVKEETEKESGKEESDDDDDDGEEVGLLDRPVEVYGCRARKQVERLEISFTSKEKQVEIPEGKGHKLVDCPRIEFQIQKTLTNDLKPLHRILFNRLGSGPEIKKNIRKFSGFTFAKDSADYEKKKVSLEKLNIPVLKQVCETLDVDRKGTKEEIVIRLLDFLMQPKDSGKSVPKAKQSKDKKKTAEKKTNKKAKSKKEVLSDDEANSADGSASEDLNDDDNEDVESDDVPPKKPKAASKSKKTPLKTMAKKIVEKKEKAKKEEKKTSKAAKRKRDDDSSEASDKDDDEEQPSSKKAKMPTDDDIKKLVKSILDSADLQEITMKKVIKQVSDAYPDSDLSHKKAFIKSTIKSVIS